MATAQKQYAALDDLIKANDLTEKDVELPALGLTVKVRALPAAYSNQAASDAMVSKQQGRDQVTTVDKGKMEVIQVLHGLVQPKFESKEQVEEFAQRVGPSWVKIVEAIDEISGVDKEAIEAVADRFPRPGTGQEGLDLEGSDSGGEGDS